MKQITILTYVVLITSISTLLNSNEQNKYTEPTTTQMHEIDAPSESITYGEHTTEIEALLSVTPVGADIYLEEQEDGNWYLKIEKTFTAQEKEKIENLEPIYTESILI